MQNTIVAPRGRHGGAPSTGGTLPLAMVTTGTTVQVQNIRGREDTRRFLEGLGFVEGGNVTVVNEINGNLIVEAKGARIALDRQMALKVMVA